MRGAHGNAENGVGYDGHPARGFCRKPAKRRQLVMRCPMVLMIRQPPAIVPPAIARWQQMITQKGTEKVFRSPPATRTVVMMPIPFCESLVPCPRLKSAAENSCNRRNH